MVKVCWIFNNSLNVLSHNTFRNIIIIIISKFHFLWFTLRCCEWRNDEGSGGLISCDVFIITSCSNSQSLIPETGLSSYQRLKLNLLARNGARCESKTWQDWQAWSHGGPTHMINKSMDQQKTWDKARPGSSVFTFREGQLPHTWIVSAAYHYQNIAIR